MRSVKITLLTGAQKMCAHKVLKKCVHTNCFFRGTEKYLCTPQKIVPFHRHPLGTDFSWFGLTIILPQSFSSSVE